MSDYEKELEQQNEELQQKLAHEQAKSHGMVSLSWTNWHPRYDGDSILLYYQSVLASYGGHFAFARITGKLDDPNMCDVMIVEFHTWCETPKSRVFTREEYGNIDTLKDEIHKKIKGMLFNKGNFVMERGESRK